MINFTKKRILLISAIASIFHFSIPSLAFAMDRDEPENPSPNIRNNNNSSPYIDAAHQFLDGADQVIGVLEHSAQVYRHGDRAYNQFQTQRMGVQAQENRGVARQNQENIELQNQLRRQAQINSDYYLATQLANQP